MSRKPFLMLVFLMSALVVGSAQAESSRQSIGAGKFALDVSYEDYDFDVRMTSSTSETPSTWNQTYGAPVKRDVWMLRASYGVLDQMDVFAGIGYADDTWNAIKKSDGSKYTEQRGKDYIWELGIKGTAARFMDNKMYVAYLAKYSYLKTGEDSYSGPPSPTVYKAVWKQYDADVEVGYDSGVFGMTPYAGVKYFHAKVEQTMNTTITHYTNRYENDDELAYFVGINQKVNNELNLTLEGIWGGKEGVKLGMQYKF